MTDDNFDLTTNCGKLPFCLSDMRFTLRRDKEIGHPEDLFVVDDVKEFIKIVEAIIMDTRLSRREKIDRLHERAGDGLIPNSQQIKKIEEFPNPHLETRSKPEEEIREIMTGDVDNHAERIYKRRFVEDDTLLNYKDLKDE